MYPPEELVAPEAPEDVDPAPDSEDHAEKPPPEPPADAVWTLELPLRFPPEPPEPGPLGPLPWPPKPPGPVTGSGIATPSPLLLELDTVVQLPWQVPIVTPQVPVLQITVT